MRIILAVLLMRERIQPINGASIPTVHYTTSTVGWVGDPNGRGTVSLLTSCLITLGLCVWSSIHLNIPPRRLSSLRLGLRYAKWGLLGIFGPELVVYSAWRQLSSARTLQEEVRKFSANTGSAHLEQKPTEKLHLEREPVDSIRNWTIVHSFYAGMGGYTFDFDMGRPPQLASCLPDLRRSTLTPRGITLLAKCNLIPDVTRHEIEDKSKADRLTKTVVCIQAGWLLVQVFGRVAQNLPVTLLEINTLAHVLCTFIIYLLWWNKPSMVSEPTQLKGDWVPAICAFMYMSSQISIWERDRQSMRRRAWLDPELSTLVYVPQNLSLQQIDPPISDTSIEVSEDVMQQSTKNAARFPHFPGAGELQPRRIVSDTSAGRRRSLEFTKASEKVQITTVNDAKRWSLAAEAIQNYPAIASRLLVKKESKGFYDIFTEELLTEHAANWPAEDLLRSTEGLIMGMILWCASMAFGAIHLSAWKEHFPSATEALLWRASAICIGPSLAAHQPFSTTFLPRQPVLGQGRGASGSLDLLPELGYSVFSLRISLRFSQVVLSSRIRALPPAAYDTPDWSQVLPHF